MIILIIMIIIKIKIKRIIIRALKMTIEITVIKKGKRRLSVT